MALRNVALYARVSADLRDAFNELADSQGIAGAELLRTLALAELSRAGRPFCRVCEQPVPVADGKPQWHRHGAKITESREDS